MNLFAAAAVMAAMLIGPLPDGAVTSRDLAAPDEAPKPRVAQNEREVRPAAQDSGQRIAAFWIILPN